MTWLVAALIAYVLFAAVSLGDRYFLSGPAPDPRVYTFFVGALGLSVMLLVPFFGFPVPSGVPLLAALIAGVLFVVAQYFLFLGLHLFQASRIIPAIGGLTPIFTFLGGAALFPDESLSAPLFAAFLLLSGGSVFLTWQGARKLFGESIAVAGATALFFGISFALSKLAYNEQSFWSAFLWMRLGGGIPLIALFLVPSVRRGVFGTLKGRHRRAKTRNRLAGLFFLNQAGGAAAVVAQHVSLSLVPVAYVAFVNALQGVQYLALLVFGAILARFHASAKLHEYVSSTRLSHRIAGVAAVCLGLAILAFAG